MLTGRELARDSLKHLEKQRTAQGTLYLPDTESPKLLNSFMQAQGKCLSCLFVLTTTRQYATRELNLIYK